MPSQYTKNISLTEEHADFVDELVGSGEYQSASEVVRTALRLLKAHDQVYEDALGELRSKIAHGLAQAEAGNLVNGAEAMDRVRRKLIKKAEEKDG